MSGEWRTIESDEGVFTQLVEKLGVEGVEFSEVLTLDQLMREEEPIYGAIFLFKYEQPNGKTDEDEETMQGKWDFDYPEELVFTKQVVNNACGTIGVVSILMTREKEIYKLGPRLEHYREFIKGMDGEMIGETLAMSEEIREIHNSFSAEEVIVEEGEDGEDERKRAGEDVFHFVGFTYANGMLYELNGLNPAPINHGAARTPKEFRENLVRVVQDRIDKYAGSELRFNLLEVRRDKRMELRRIGDVEGLKVENDKRARWKREQCLREGNYMGVILRLLGERRGVIE